MSAGGPAVTIAPSPGSVPAAPAPAAPVKDAPKEAAPGEKKPGIKPIPPKPRGQSLPGVWTQRGDPQDEVIERKHKEREAAASKTSDAGTPADKTAAQPKEGIPKDAPPKQADTTKVAPESEAFSEEHLAALEGEDADPEKLKHAFKTLKGMHKAVLKEKETTKEIRAKAVKLAHDWKAEAERLQSEVTTLRARGGAAEPGSAPPQPTAKGAEAATPAEPRSKLLEAIPLDTFEAIVEKHGTGVALTWALEKAHKLALDQFKETLNQRLAPVEQTAQVSAQVKRVVDTFRGVAEIRDPVSQDYFYPELHDPALLERVIHVWKELRLPDEVAYSPKGVHTAVIIVRDAMGRLGVQVAPTKNPPAQPAPEPASNPQVDKVAEALAASLNRSNPGQVLDGSSAAINRPANGEVTQEMLIRREILNAQPIHPKLGFGRR